MLSSRKALVYTEASVDSWTAAMDQVLTNDSGDSVARLKWRPSRNGGRTVASPTATTTALTATRRMGTRHATQLDYAATISLQGEAGKEDGEVLRQLMEHAVTATGLRLQPATSPESPQLGEYVHLASVDPSAPPGRMRVLLREEADVRRLRAALGGQSIQVGHDYVGVRVANDIIDATSAPGNGNRRRK